MEGAYMNKEEYKKMLTIHNVENNPILNTKTIIDPSNIKELPFNEWVLINSSRIGLVYVYRIKSGVFIEFRRKYSDDYNFYTNEYFNNWRSGLNG